MLQSLVSARTRSNVYVRGDAAWVTLVRNWKRGRLDLESPREVFDHLESEGVLLLNTSLTVSVNIATRKPMHGHFPLAHIPSQNGKAVFLLWGRNACEIFERADIRAAAERAGTWTTKIAAVQHANPAAITKEGAVFLRPPNPFLSANQALEKLGAKPIHW
jgi:uracil DNA glycosylase